MSRRVRVLPGVLFLLLLPALAAAGADDGASGLRRWAFGWDPVESGAGLTVRYRFSPRWDLSIAAGPNDYRYDEEARDWDDDDVFIDDGAEERTDDRREQGWVRLVAGGRFWREDRVSVSGVCGVTYRWSAEESRYRDYDNYIGAQWDYRNQRIGADVDTWTVALGIRPALEITPRLAVEFEAGLAFSRTTTAYESDTWWDTFPETARTEEVRHGRTFRSYGGFELSQLKFIFRF